jgi:hypothetical protein
MHLHYTFTNSILHPGYYLLGVNYIFSLQPKGVILRGAALVPQCFPGDHPGNLANSGTPRLIPESYFWRT